MANNTPKTVNLDDEDEFDGGQETEGAPALDQEIDFETVKGIVTVTRGMYHLRVLSAKATLSKQKLPMISAMLEVLSDGEFQGGKIPQYFSLGPNALDITHQRLVGMGLPKGIKASPRALAEAISSDGGLEFYAIVDVQHSNGINPETDEPYPDRNRLVMTSTSPIAPRR